MSGWWTGLTSVGWPGWLGTLEIGVLAVAFYLAMLFFKGTRGAQVWLGLVVVGLLLVVTWVLHLNTLNWLLQRLTGSLVVAIVIIFQPEIRRALAELGKQRVLGREKREDILDELLEAVFSMSENKIGALIALERGVGTRAVQETGTRLDAEVSAPLLAGCVFPLSDNRMSGKSGTRHRAALGMSEESDALVVVVSEETGAVSLASGGRLVRGLTEKELRRYLSSLFVKGQEERNPLKRLKQALDFSPEAMERNDAE